MEPRAARLSHTTITELMIPAYANFGGKVHGGVILELMDKVAYACAAKHAGGYCVTVAVEGVDFRAPVDVGDLVSLHAAVNYVGRSSLLVGIRVEAENVRIHAVRHTNTSYFWMVAKDDAGNPRQVPPLLLETRDEARRFLEAIHRKQMRKRHAEELDNAASDLAVDREIHRLEQERCVLGPEVELGAC
jgi:acyl-CoA hydrolase